MCDQWMPTLKLAMSADAFRQLPRNPAYRYELIDGIAVLSPRTKHYHAVLDLAAYRAEPIESIDAEIRAMQPGDREELIKTFSWAFHRIQPYAGLDDETRLEASRRSLEKTWTGGDGPLIEQASFIAVDPERHFPLAGLFVTLLPGGDPCEWDSYSWPTPAPPEAVMRQTGQPHLTWIFVAPVYAGGGIGSALLQRAVTALRDLHYTSLWSTFLSANESSMLWHWRSGFQLVSYPASRRRMRLKLASNTRSDDD